MSPGTFGGEEEEMEESVDPVSPSSWTKVENRLMIAGDILYCDRGF